MAVIGDSHAEIAFGINGLLLNFDAVVYPKVFLIPVSWCSDLGGLTTVCVLMKR